MVVPSFAIDCLWIVPNTGKTSGSITDRIPDSTTPRKSVHQLEELDDSMVIEHFGSFRDPVGILKDQIAIGPSDLGVTVWNEGANKMIDEPFFLPEHAGGSQLDHVGSWIQVKALLLSKNAFDREKFRSAFPALLGKHLVVEPS
jgi:hypothetical protein